MTCEVCGKAVPKHLAGGTVRRAKYCSGACRQRAYRQRAKVGGDRPERGGHYLDSFVGRGRELAELGALVTATRLLTLVGPAGVGKTRLAVEVLTRYAFGEGDVLVRLGSLTRGEDVPQAFAGAVGAIDMSGSDVTDALISALVKRGPLLVVLDNCEHLLGPCCTLLSTLLARCPDLRVLATSRERLRLPGEVTYRVQRLEVNPPNGGESAGAGERTDAVRLFVDRARTAASGCEFSHADIKVVAAICTRLDGLPLAIELAAPLVGPLPLTEIHDRLDERFSLLAGGWRNADRRHQNLRAAIEWSYDLLSPVEQTWFRGLSVLPGGFELGFAEGFSADGSALASVMCLEAKSLITPSDHRSESARFRMLESIRIYGREKLLACGEEEVAYGRAVAWLTGLAAPIMENMTLPVEVSRRLDDEHDNFVHILEWLGAGDDERQLLLAVALAEVRVGRGYLGDSAKVLRGALGRTSVHSEYRSIALASAAIVTGWEGRHQEASHFAANAVCLERRRGREPVLGRVLRAQIQVLMAAGDPDGVITCAPEVLKIGRRLGDDATTMLTLDDLAWHLLQRGDVAEAGEMLKEALVICRVVEVPWPRARLLHTVGAHALMVGDLSTAKDSFVRSLLDAGEHPQDVANAIDGLGVVAIRTGSAERGLRLIAAAEDLALTAHAERARWWLDLVAAAKVVALDALPGPRAAPAIEWGRGLSLRHVKEYALDAGALRAAGTESLTRREVEVVRLVARALTNHQIAASLHLSVRTVEDHVRRVRQKLGLRNRAELMTWATRRPRA